MENHFITIIIIIIIFFFFFFFFSSSSFSFRGTASCVLYCTTRFTVSSLYILVLLSSIHIYLCIPDKGQDAGLKTNPCYCQRGFSSAVKITALTKSGQKPSKGLDAETDRLTFSCEMRFEIIWRTVWLVPYWLPVVLTNCSGALCDWYHIWVPVVLINCSGALCDWCHISVPAFLNRLS